LGCSTFLEKSNSRPKTIHQRVDKSLISLELAAAFGNLVSSLHASEALEKYHVFPQP
jgi:hypothetical protein